MAIAQFLAAVEGFDIYPSGALKPSYPWYITNQSLAGQINLTGGAFGGGALTFPTTGAPSTMTSGTELQFPSTMQMQRTNTTANGTGVFSVNGWLNVAQMSVGNSGPLLGLGTAGAVGNGYTLLSVANTSSSGLVLQFPTNINNATSAPYNFAIQPNTQYWIQIIFAFQGSASSPVLTASYAVNGTTLLLDQPVSWTSDGFSAGQVANRLRFYCSSFISYFWDDLVIQAVSAADTGWPVAANTAPTPESIPGISARRVYAISATGNGSLTQWTPSGSEPNWQSATDPTGANYVTAESAGLTDLYKWEANTMSDIRGLVIRGNSTRYQNISASFKTSSTGGLTQIKTVSGPSTYVAISENDGSNAWTTTTINNAEFGQTSK